MLKRHFREGSDISFTNFEWNQQPSQDKENSVNILTPVVRE